MISRFQRYCSRLSVAGLSIQNRSRAYHDKHAPASAFNKPQLAHHLPSGGRSDNRTRLGLLDLPEKINKFYKELPQAAENTGIWPPIDKRFAGAWKMVPQCKNDPFEVGDLDNPDEKPEPRSHGLDLELTFEGQVVSGQIMTDKLAKNYVTPEVAMVGHAVGPTAHMRVVDWRDGKAITLAWIDVSRVGDNCLDFTATTDGMNYFPKHASLARQSDDEYKSIPRRHEMPERVTQNARREIWAKRVFPVLS